MIRTFTRISAVAACVAAALTLTPSVAAQEVEYEAIELKKLADGRQVLSEDKGYIYVRSSARSQGSFIKAPDAEDIAAFEAEWREELEEAIEKYPRRLERWNERRLTDRKPGPRPVEPTEESFSIGSIETRLFVGYGPQYVFDKGKLDNGDKYFDYLIELEPGEYTYYGPMALLPAGAFGACYCMGSVKFTVEPGVITSLGNFLEGTWVSPEALRQSSIFADTMPPRSGEPADWSVPDTLSALPAVQAELFAAGKMNNFYRAGVARMPPVEGVLAYERDTVIDVRAEIAAAEEAAEAERLAAEQAAAEAAAAEQARLDAAAAAEAAMEAVDGASADAEAAVQED